LLPHPMPGSSMSTGADAKKKGRSLERPFCIDQA
jgi:hypothetical protein